MKKIFSCNKVIFALCLLFLSVVGICSADILPSVYSGIANNHGLPFLIRTIDDSDGVYGIIPDFGAVIDYSETVENDVLRSPCLITSDSLISVDRLDDEYYGIGFDVVYSNTWEIFSKLEFYDILSFCSCCGYSFTSRKAFGENPYFDCFFK